VPRYTGVLHGTVTHTAAGPANGESLWTGRALPRPGEVFRTSAATSSGASLRDELPHEVLRGIEPSYPATCLALGVRWVHRGHQTVDRGTVCQATPLALSSGAHLRPASRGVVSAFAPLLTTTDEKIRHPRARREARRHCPFR